MMKMKKLMVLLLAGMMSFGAIACGDKGGWGDDDASTSSVEEVIEGVTNPYKLTMFNFTGGYGEEWLNTLVTRYKKERAGKVFTVDGKEYDGVDFEIAKEKTTTLITQLRRQFFVVVVPHTDRVAQCRHSVNVRPRVHLDQPAPVRTFLELQRGVQHVHLH